MATLKKYNVTADRTDAMASLDSIKKRVKFEVYSTNTRQWIEGEAEGYCRRTYGGRWEAYAVEMGDASDSGRSAGMTVTDVR